MITLNTAISQNNIYNNRRQNISFRKLCIDNDVRLPKMLLKVLRERYDALPENISIKPHYLNELDVSIVNVKEFIRKGRIFPRRVEKEKPLTEIVKLDDEQESLSQNMIDVITKLLNKAKRISAKNTLFNAIYGTEHKLTQPKVYIDKMVFFNDMKTSALEELAKVIKQSPSNTQLYILYNKEYGYYKIMLEDLRQEESVFSAKAVTSSNITEKLRLLYDKLNESRNLASQIITNQQ